MLQDYLSRLGLTEAFAQGWEEDFKAELEIFKKDRLDDTIDRLIGEGLDKNETISLVNHFHDNPDDISEGYMNPDDFVNFHHTIVAALLNEPDSKFTAKNMEEDTKKEELKDIVTEDVIDTMNSADANQLKNLLVQKDMLMKKIDLLKDQIQKKKPMTEDLEEANKEDNSKELIELFAELNRMEKRHARTMAKITTSLENEKTALHEKIREVMNKNEEKEPVLENFSFRDYFIKSEVKQNIDTMIENLNEYDKIRITNRVLCEKFEVLDEDVLNPTVLTEALEFYGEQNFKCRFIKEMLTEMAVQQSRDLWMVRWKDGTKPQQYPYAFNAKDTESVESAKEKAIEAALKKIEAGKNDVRVVDGRDGTVISGKDLKVGRPKGMTAKVVIDKAKTERDNNRYLVISFKPDTKEETDKVVTIVPKLLEELKSLDRDLLDFEEDFSDENNIDISIDLYNSERSAVKAVLMNERMGMGSIVVDKNSSDVLHGGIFKVDHEALIDYDTEIMKDDKKIVKDGEELSSEIIDEPIVVDEPKETIVKKPSKKQVIARKKFSKGNRILKESVSTPEMNKNLAYGLSQLILDIFTLGEDEDLKDIKRADSWTKFKDIFVKGSEKTEKDLKNTFNNIFVRAKKSKLSIKETLLGLLDKIKDAKSESEYKTIFNSIQKVKV